MEETGNCKFLPTLIGHHLNLLKTPSVLTGLSEVASCPNKLPKDEEDTVEMVSSGLVPTALGVLHH